MHTIQKLTHGAALLCLLALLTSCASNPPTKTVTVEVVKPILVPLPREYTAHPPVPALKADATNDDLADLLAVMRAALKTAYGQLDKIMQLQPEPAK